MALTGVVRRVAPTAMRSVRVTLWPGAGDW